MATPPPPLGPVDEKTKYEQLCNDFRSLNGFLWQTPILFMTLTGGLWFAVASFDLTDLARFWLLMFAGIANLLMIAALYRLRFVMHGIMKRIQALDGRPEPGLNFFIVTCLSLLLLMAAAGSFLAGAKPSRYFSNGAAATSEKMRDAARQKNEGPNSLARISPAQPGRKGV